MYTNGCKYVYTTRLQWISTVFDAFCEGVSPYDFDGFHSCKGINGVKQIYVYIYIYTFIHIYIHIWVTTFQMGAMTTQRQYYNMQKILNLLYVYIQNQQINIVE